MRGARDVLKRLASAAALGRGSAATSTATTSQLVDASKRLATGLFSTQAGGIGAQAAGPVKEYVWAKWGFAAAGLAAGATASVVALTSAPTPPASSTPSQASAPAASSQATGQDESAAKYQVVFVLGGPGSGKGTQCAKLVKEFGVLHLSAGDLLREHVKSGSAEGNMVADMIKKGQIVPAQVTVGLLKAAMHAGGKQKVLIDGFPRSVDNRDAFQEVMGYDCDFVLWFDCPEEVLQQRLLARQEGRTDDNIASIRKRFQVYESQSMPVIRHYDKEGKLRRIDTNQPVDKVYECVRPFFL